MSYRVHCLLAAGLLTAPLLIIPGPVQAAPRAACTRVSRDYNGDGHADIAASAYDYNGGQGAVAVAYGPAGTGPKQLLAGPSGSLTSGFFDGDCFADLAVGGSGRVSVLFGSPSGLSTTRSRSFTSASIPDGETRTRFGGPLAAGDFDSDGVDELLVGAAGRSIEEQGGEPQPEDDGGGVAIFPGTPTGPTATGGRWLTAPTPHQYERFGSALAVGDFDGDQRPDLAVGVPESGNIFGSVQVFRSATGTPAVFSQDTAGVPGSSETADVWGSTLAAGDLSGDGRDDLVVGALGEDGNAGAVTVLKGSAKGLTGTGALRFTQDTAGIPGTLEAQDEFGASLAVGDLTGDGRPELVVGSPREDVGSVLHTGSVTVISGLTGTGARYLDQNSPGVPGSNEADDEFGAPVRVIDGNLVVGAPNEVTTGQVGAFTVLTGNLSAGTFFGPAQFPDAVVPDESHLGAGLA